MDTGSTKRKKGKFSKDTGQPSKRREINPSLEKRMEECTCILEKSFEITMIPFLQNIGLLRIDKDASSSLRKTFDEVLQCFATHEKWEKVLSKLENFEGNMESRKTTQFEMNPTKEHLIDDKLKIHFYIASNQFHKMLSKMTSAALPKKRVMNSCDAIESITYIHNDKLAIEYTIQKEVFKMQGKVTPHGNVKELLLFHGTANENIENIINTNFLIDRSPIQEGESQGRKKSMLFGRGIYFSEIPGVSLMYGSGLLLCKVIVGNCELFKPQGEIPPDISDDFDSREVIKDGVGVVHVVKKSSQILPYCIIKLRKESLINSTKPTTMPMIPSQTMAYQQKIKKQLENKGVF